MRKLIEKMLVAKISLPSYLWVYSSFVIALYLFIHRAAVVSTTFASHLPVNLTAWSIILLAGNVICVLGMILQQTRYPVIRTGAFICFLAWLFAGIDLIQLHQWFSIIFLIVPYVVIYIYLFLGASLGVFTKAKHFHYHR